LTFWENLAQLSLTFDVVKAFFGHPFFTRPNLLLLLLISPEREKYMNASMTISGQLSERTDFDDYRQANKIKSARFLYDRDDKGSFSPVRPIGLGALMPGEAGSFTIGNLPVERTSKLSKQDNPQCQYKYSGRIERKRFAGLTFHWTFTAAEKFDAEGNLIEATIEYPSGAPTQYLRLADQSSYCCEAKKKVRTVLEPKQALLVTVIDDYAAVFVSDSNGYVIADSLSLKGSVKLMQLYPHLHQECLARQARTVK